MTDIQTWLDQVSARLEAVKREPAQEERDYDHESLTWSELYRHAPTDLEIALEILNRLSPASRSEARTLYDRATRGRRND